MDLNFPAETVDVIGNEISVHFENAMEREIRQSYVPFKNALEMSTKDLYRCISFVPKCPKVRAKTR